MIIICLIIIIVSTFLYFASSYYHWIPKAVFVQWYRNHTLALFYFGLLFLHQNMLNPSPSSLEKFRLTHHKHDISSVISPTSSTSFAISTVRPQCGNGSYPFIVLYIYAGGCYCQMKITTTLTFKIYKMCTSFSSCKFFSNYGILISIGPYLFYSTTGGCVNTSLTFLKVLVVYCMHCCYVVKHANYVHTIHRAKKNNQ